MAAITVETNWFTSSAMLMPFERMRVGISSDRASHTHTPGPTAKLETNTQMAIATSQPCEDEGTGPRLAFSMRSGASRPAAGSANGFRCSLRKNTPITLSACTASSRAMDTWRSTGSSLRRLFTLVKGP